MSTAVTRSKNLDPNDWMRKRFPAVFGKLPGVKAFRWIRGGTMDFAAPYIIARCVGPEGSPDTPLQYSPKSGRYYRYDPNLGVYEELSREAAMDRIQQSLTRCALASDPKQRDAVLSVCEPAKLSKVLTAIRGREPFPIPCRNPRSGMIHVENGVVDLKTLSLREFSPEHRATWKLPVRWDKHAPEPPRFRAMLARLCPAPEDQELLLHVLASAFLGNPGQHIVLIAGAGGVGKSTLISFLATLLGPNACGGLHLDHASERFTAADWADRLLLYQAEVKQKQLDGSYETLKAISGHDVMAGERKYAQERIHFRPHALPILVTNKQLRFQVEEDMGAMRRRLIAFDVPKPASPFRKVPDFADLLVAHEGPGILRLLLEAAHRVHTQGIPPLTLAQESRRDSYLGLADPLAEWASRYVRAELGQQFSRDEAIRHATKWLSDRNRAGPVTPTAWSKRLNPVIEAIGGRPTRSLNRGRGSVGWRQVRLSSTV